MANETRRRDATLAMETLRAAGASVTGLVFNKVKSSNGYTDNYRY